MTAFLKRILCGNNLKMFLNKIGNIKVFSQGNIYQQKQNGIKQLYGTSSKSQQVYLIDEDDNSNSDSINSINKYTNRTYTCGELRRNNSGEAVILCGWLKYQRMNKFVVLRDAYGETQLLIRNEDTKIQNRVKSTTFESVVEVKGTVVTRPKDMINEKQATGEVEVLVDCLKVVNKAKDNLPFNIREFQKAKEPLRMQYRYLDLRFPQMQKNLRVRSKMLMKMREFLINNHFVDVETPTLFKATPGGAQEFIVPTRFPGQFYSLVQSPQQFKQMLMAGAIDRYFQIARCYRDEGSRSDRQPEFTQLDIEMSFTNLKAVLTLVEELLSYSWPEYLSPIPIKFERISYKDAMENYGSDKPDVRFDFKLQNCTELLKVNSKLVQNDDFGAYFITIPKEYANLTKQIKERLLGLSRKFPRATFVQRKVYTTKDWIDKVSKLLTNSIATKFVEENTLQDESILFLSYGNKYDVLSLLGNVRLEYMNFLENLGISIRKKEMHFLWINDFPLFEISEDTGCLQSAHHPFTSPHPDDLHLLKTDPIQVRALAYDLVLNGNEVGGGSIRIHDPSLQEAILDLLNIKKDTMQHIIDMLGSGCPPHGGIALGLDRLLSILLSATSIRDVIAFPKNFEGRDPLSGAPSYISEKDKKLYHIQTKDIEKE